MISLCFEADSVSISINSASDTTIIPTSLVFSRSTPVIPTLDFGQTYLASLSNPFPDNRLLQPVGSSLGVNLDAGKQPRSVGYIKARNPYTMQWSFGIQQLCPASFSWIPAMSAAKALHCRLICTGIRVRWGLISIRCQDSTYRLRLHLIKPTWISLNAPIANPFFGLPQFDGRTCLVQKSRA